MNPHSHTRPGRGDRHRWLGLLLGLAAVSSSQAAEVGVFTGGDPGEGLDLQGNFIYAVNIGTGGPAGQAGDADFTADDAPGVTVTAGNQILDWNTAAAYGDSVADDVLEYVIRSIRWSNAADPAIPVVTVQLTGIEVGARYKLQLLFGEGCCPNRAFDVYLNGVVIATEVNPGGLQGGSNVDYQGAYLSEEFTATMATLDVVLDGRTVTNPDFTDRNAILSGLTLEKLSSASDTDGDGLSDAWENQQFGNLNQTASGDPDTDGLDNMGEFTRATNPNNPDTDGDTLTDGAEVNTHRTDPLRVDTDADTLSDATEVNVTKTDPTKADTDGDGLRDGWEINMSLTDPLKADTDGDGVNDYDELRLLSNPNDANSKPGKTSIAVFTGGDAGEGLDLDGTFLYAIHLGTDDPIGLIRDADFNPDYIDGVVVRAQNTAVNWNPEPNYGDSANDDALEFFMNTIRWSDVANAAQPSVDVELANLQVGATYKLQFLFAEACCPRGFDVSVNGRPIADDFSPQFYQGGYRKTNGVVLTHEFISRSNLVTAVLDGRGVTLPEFTDRNAILQALTLEVVQPATDTDGDGLPDAWEMEVFGNLTQTASGDSDNDGLPNNEEFSFGTDPNKADEDNDGLNDSQEIKTHRTSPFRADTDGDGLNDGAEVLTHGTDPLRPDTDSDGVTDGAEVAAGTNPADAPTVFSNILVQGITGGDPEDGVDLQGNFVYAVNVSSAGAAGKAYDADFTADTVPGVSVLAPNNIAAWNQPEYGDSAADNVMEFVTQSIRYGPTVGVRLTGLFPGSTYKVQLFFYEQCCANRGFNVYGDGVLIAEDFVPHEIQGGVNNTAGSAMVSAEFVTQRDSLYIVLDAAAAPREDLTDPNAILDGFTLEALNLVAPPSLTMTRAEDGRLTISTDATLQSADTVQGPYVNLPDKTITVDPKTAAGPKFYRSRR